ncbi:MAG: UxaA family hydrolase [Caldilineaceae bacterium]|nr:UxaA family hydrolase [Caldilineaceae bacterium]
MTLVHTEGCGCSAPVKEMTTEVLLGYLRHQRVKYALLLEHGCEMTHNDHMRLALAEMNLQADDFGWAGIQLDGGIVNVLNKIDFWFDENGREDASPIAVPLTSRTIGLWSDGSPDPESARAFALPAGSFASIY